jgi:quercetin dioxygenase-like cupin family protein
VFPGVHAMLSGVTIESFDVARARTSRRAVGVCLEGEWIRIQAAVGHHMKAGDFWQTPPNVPHGGRTLDSRCVVLDIFAPPREEYRQAGRGLGAASVVGR